ALDRRTPRDPEICPTAAPRSTRIAPAATVARNSRRAIRIAPPHEFARSDGTSPRPSRFQQRQQRPRGSRDPLRVALAARRPRRLRPAAVAILRTDEVGARALDRWAARRVAAGPPTDD